MLGGRGERRGDLGAEDDIFDENAFNGDTPLVGDVADYFGNLVGNSLALSDNALDGTSTNDVTKGRLGTLDECLAKVGDPEGSTIGIGDLEVDDGVTINRALRSVILEDKRRKAHISTLTLSLVLYQGFSDQEVKRGSKDIHDRLPSNGTNLDFDIHDFERFSADVNLNQTGIHRFVELTEARDQADGAY